MMKPETMIMTHAACNQDEKFQFVSVSLFCCLLQIHRTLCKLLCTRNTYFDRKWSNCWLFGQMKIPLCMDGMKVKEITKKWERKNEENKKKSQEVTCMQLALAYFLFSQIGRKCDFQSHKFAGRECQAQRHAFPTFTASM